MFLRFLPRHPLLRLALLLAWLACVVILSLTAKPPRSLALVSDKLLHAGSYAILTLLCAGVVVPRLRHRVAGWLLSVVAVSLVGLVLEIAQGLMRHHRQTDPYDLLANLVGALLVAVPGLLFASRGEEPAAGPE